jgi:hypothetical protein
MKEMSMQKAALGPELAKAINRTAQALETQAFSAVRDDLEQQALEMLCSGKTRDDVTRFIVGESVPSALRLREAPCDLA